MSPRNSGPRYSPDPPPRNQSASNPNAPAANADTPPYQYGRKTWSGGGLPGSGSATPERTIAFSTTVLDSVIPFVYGERKVTGMCCARGEYTGQYKPFVFLFAFGKQDSITDCRVNGTPIGNIDWITNIAYRYGTGSETIPTGYTTLGDSDDWKKYAYVCFKINTLEADVPGSLDVTAVLGGQHVYDFRSDTTDVSANPVLIAYNIQTNPYWKGLASARIDADQWEPVADWCDEAMGDSTARFEFNGVVYQRDPEAAVSEVLGHCFASMYFGADGKLRLWSEMDPPAITGEWSATASATITEDSTAGEATTEVEAGDILYVGTDVRTVVSVTDDDTIVLDSALTVSGVTVRKTSGVYIRKENWATAPTGRNLAPGSIPDVVIVNHTQSNDWGSYQYPRPGDVSGDKRLEISAIGCTNASQAARMSITHKNIQTLQPFFWSNGVADGTAAGLEPGDVFFFDDDVLTMQAARVLPPVNWLTNGLIGIDCREYDPNASSLDTEADDTPPSVDPGWVLDDPDAPTAATQTFGESGDWDTASLLADPDDLETDWSDGAGISGAYSSGDDWTEFTVSTPATALSYSPAVGGATSGLKMVTCLAKTDSGGVFIAISNRLHTASKGLAQVTGDETWHRITIIWSGASDDEIYISGTAAAASDYVQVRRMRIVDWVDNPALKLYERWDWTEHANASSSVSKYRMTDGDNLAIILDEVPQGAVTLEHVMLVVGISGQTTQWGTGTAVEAAMYAVGPNGGVAAFPTPTQAIELRDFGQGLDTFRANDLLDSARIGDINNSDYLEISKTGHLTLVGDATVWEDLRFPVGMVSRLGFSDPDWVQLQDNGSSSVGVYALGFSSTTDEEVFFSIQLPHAWKEASSIHPHVHWSPLVASEGGDEGVCWALEYTWANIGVVDGVGSPVTFGNTITITTSDVDTFTALEHRMVNFDPITATGKTISSMLMCRLYRDVSDTDDDYASDALLLEFDIHVECDSLGSNTVSSKT